MRVSLTLSEHWPEHGSEASRQLANSAARNHHNAKWNQWRGKEIEVLAPVRADKKSWTCNTKQVWPVTDAGLCNHFGIPEEYRGRFFVCEHQIQLPVREP